MGLRSCDPSVLSLLLSSQPGAAEAGALLREPPRGLVHVWGSLRGGGSGVVLGFRFPAGCRMGWGAVLAAGPGGGISAGSPGRRCWVSEGSKGRQHCCYPALEQAWRLFGHQMPKERGANKSSALRLLCGLLMFNISTEKPGVEMFPNPLVLQVET